jgi:hypothetical protein
MTRTTAGLTRPAARTTWPRALGGLAGQLLLAWAGVLAVVVAFGLLLTHGLDGLWPLTREDDLNRWFEAARTPTRDDVTFWLGEIGNTATIVVLCAVFAGLMRRRLHRWRESIQVITSAIGQSLVSCAPPC